jgi:hypothetical protein
LWLRTGVPFSFLAVGVAAGPRPCDRDTSTLAFAGRRDIDDLSPLDTHGNRY